MPCATSPELDTLSYISLLIFAKLKIEAFDHVWKTLDSSLYTFLHTRRTEFVASPGQDAQPEAGDIFSLLVAAMDSKGKLDLNEREVIGNTFTLMFAGHESTAATVAATLGFPAIHQDQQGTTYREIFTAIPVTRDPTFNDFPKMPLLQACFYEALRIFPSAMLIAKETTEDVPIKVQSPAEKVMYSNASVMIIEMIATRAFTQVVSRIRRNDSLDHNPRCFPEPEEHRPSRWCGEAEFDISTFGVLARN
ncbi:cytochrome P450 [Mycena vulgaris]|nr:cytochrome P450 [Mycena vulgaris]